ncbi:hypothetical protein GQ55_7G195100 [Panicum hallii var. hallii]|uniref:Uncharacterized protein n=1 Tax=Panicum hallii var. hallii TaxID=1504633 RepID=A0A2T7CWR9_9POAL|nr:hypothetical protein GQ55_7G195100 [Panicum hallii var. hallii]PUZ47798.1 hypothetical protein GQ55_7G195100 [Panicum hallii var. hallii]PUZ47799.1 hypothetical protein GQ55_7G195100 [Panicum hallii var. hallii]PUZ47800.1 hypothetical protein GQ55_7G195100 [Panicum hallii var. hallii]PUZ47801.1 hypothetical protein GQ55_7G195100 [Panicum hallii var. hallii]
MPLRRAAACRRPRRAPFQRYPASFPAETLRRRRSSCRRVVVPSHAAPASCRPSCHPNESLPPPRRVLEIPASSRLGNCGRDLIIVWQPNLSFSNGFFLYVPELPNRLIC